MIRNFRFLATLIIGLAFLLLFLVETSAQNASPLCFTARNGTVIVTFDVHNVTHTIQYSTNGTSWNTYTSSTSVTINANNSVYFRAATDQVTATAFGDLFDSGSSVFSFTASNGGTVEASGNIMSLYGPSCPNLLLSTYAFANMFYGCTALTTAPALPATLLGNSCYSGMFDGCTSLTAPPALPATTLASYCYYGMFNNCTALTTAPALPATTLASHCYHSMFSGCTALTAAPALSASILAEYCYSSMFNGCTSLIAPPALPATTLFSYCYYYMFCGCSFLTSLPVLPATTLADHCYACMFQDCKSLRVDTIWPGKEWRISATSAADNSLDYMFYKTSGHLASISSDPSINTTYYIASDISGVPLNFTARNGSVTVAFDIKNATHTIQYSTNEGTTWNNYTSNTGITLNKDEKIYFQAASNQTTATAFGSSSSQNFSKFLFTSTNGGTIEASGNIMSLYGSNCPNLSLSQYAFSNIFSGCTLLTTPPALCATTLAANCYEEMFNGCTALKILPSLPATSLVSGCYHRMFYGCSSLKVDSSFPGRKWKIPAASSATTALTDMFSNTTGTMNGTPSVNTTYYVSSDELSIPLNFTVRNGTVDIAFDLEHTSHELEYSINGGTTWNDYSSNAAITLYANEKVYFRAKANQIDAMAFGYYGLIYYYRSCQFNFTSPDSGTVEASGNIMSLYGPDCPDLQLPNYAFMNLFDGCTLLTTAPLLPSKNLADWCYWYMFSGCTSLTTAPTLPATTLSDNCYQGMFYNCSSLTTAPALPATTMTNSCYSSMFGGCSSLTATPDLPATTLADYCYMSMFRNCTSITTPPALPVTVLTNSCYNSMFEGCTSLTSTPTLPAIILTNSCYSGMFSGCTSLRLPPTLPATTMAELCYSQMFSGCTSLVTIPDLLANTLEEYCYSNMFYGCTSLEVDTTGPGKPWIIPTRTAPDGSLYSMFTNTVGTMNGTPAVNTTYYIASDPSFRSTVSTAVNDTSMGSVAGAGSYMNGTTVTLTATPNAHYHFVQWSNGATTQVISFTVNCDTAFTAVFAIDQHTVTVNANDTSMGSVFGGGTFNYGDTVTLTATPTAHHHLANWSNGKTTESITITVGGDTTITAIFAIDQHQVTANTSDSSMGYVSGGGMYNYNTTATLTAIPNANYRFVNWNNGDTTSAITVTVLCDTTLTAYFENCPQKSNDVYDTICQGELYSGYGAKDVAINQDTILSVITKMADNCDSTTYIYISSLPSYNIIDSATINEGETYTWRGNTYSESGDYSDTLVSENGCDSIITLHLVVKGETAVQVADDITISVIPNPVNTGNTALLYGDFEEVVTIEVINNFGQTIEKFSAEGNPISIPAISDPGIYYVRIVTADGKYHLNKLVVI